MATAVPPASPTGSEPALAPAPTPAPARRRRPQKRHLKWIVAAIVLVAAGIFGFRYWRETSTFVTTDNAYVQANQAEITSQVAGQVTAVHVRDQQRVQEGDPLFDVDMRNFQLAVERAKAEVAQRRAEAMNAEGLYHRNQQLQASGFLSKQGGETSRAQMASADAAVQVALAAEKQAELDLDRAHVKSPATGTIANLTLRPGNMVQPGVPLFVVIAEQEFWVDANFKETQLKEIHPGQKVEIHSDVYPDRDFHGVVESVSGGSGAAFSVLPPQNATGNWVKVTQRVPVRIRIEDPDPQHPLRIGTTATVKVRKDG
jgi:membrane fusion protein (multidrug efflux system)